MEPRGNPFKANVSCSALQNFLTCVGGISNQLLPDGVSLQLTALVADLASFSSPETKKIMLPQDAKLNLSHASWFHGSMLLSQVMSRELKPGETRIGLVGRCLQLMEKRSMGCEQSLKSKAIALTKQSAK